MNAFVDGFGSKHVQVHFDTGNVMLFQFPEHWIPILGRRIKNVHFKEFSKKGTDHSLDSFRTLLDGTTNWPAVMDALEQAGYEGYLTFEYFHPFLHYPEALVEQSSDALDRIMGRKAAETGVLIAIDGIGRQKGEERIALGQGEGGRYTCLVNWKKLSETIVWSGHLLETPNNGSCTPFPSPASPLAKGGLGANTVELAIKHVGNKTSNFSPRRGGRP